MKIIVIGATGTIGAEVAKALLASRHEIVRASRNGEVKVNLEDCTSIRAMFDQIQGGRRGDLLRRQRGLQTIRRP